MELNPETLSALGEACAKEGLELSRNEDGSLIMIGSKYPTSAVINRLVKYIPAEVTYRFEEGPKRNTLLRIQDILKQLGLMFAANMRSVGDDRNVVIDIMGLPLMDPAESIAQISDLLYKDGFFNAWKFVYNGQQMLHMDRDEYAKTLELVKAQDKIQSRPKPVRETIISEDDITNLHILLNEEISFDEFLEKI